jgi:uncharacterized RDD family membrane protein YckC
MPLISRQRTFDPHESARADSLAGAPLARFRPRFLAFVIDFFLTALLYAPVEFLRQYAILTLHHAPKKDIHIDVNFHEFGFILFCVLYFGLITWLTNGQTLGKRLFRVRVVSLTHSKITLWQAIERSLGYGASALEGGFGFLQYFIHHNHACVHDRIAETIVVQDSGSSPPSVILVVMTLLLVIPSEAMEPASVLAPFSVLPRPAQNLNAPPPPSPQP